MNKLPLFITQIFGLCPLFKKKKKEAQLPFSFTEQMYRCTNVSNTTTEAQKPQNITFFVKST